MVLRRIYAMQPYLIIYRGTIRTEQLEEPILKSLENELLKIDLPWDTEAILEIDNNIGTLSYCALLANKEAEIRQALETVIKHSPNATGMLYCYGDHSHDIRRFIVRNERLYEQTTTIEYEEPGRCIYVRIPA